MLNGKHTLYLIEPKTGKSLNSDGSLWKSGDRLEYEDTFNNFEDAQKEKDNLLEKVVWASVMIYEEDTKKENYYSNREIELQYLSEHEQMNNYLSLPWYKRVFFSKPILKYVKT